MKNLKKVLALVLAVVMIMGTVAVASAKDYSDVKADNTYANAIDALSGLEILNGFPDETFRPEGTLTRAEAAKIVAIIHNAATNGKIDADIADLYKNAQNSFVDCNNSWALPYINYCRITGLADGMTTTTYEPNRALTGVQFLKLMLTTLNFDSAKEGYTGKGWDINVLNRANEIGLTDGLEDGWQGIKELKRGEAAQIIYNALTKYLVEYGQLVKNNYTAKGYYTASFISNEQVAQSGYTLGAKMGITIKRATDKFRRPGYSWSYARTGWSAFYMDTPAAEYTNVVSACTILKDVIGLPEYKTTPVALDGISGETETAVGLLMGGKAEGLGTALNYVAIDGFKYLGYTLKHDDSRSCQDTTGKWNFNAFGGQGDLTQVFETEDGYVITVIHTFLAKVESVNTVNRKSDHTASNSSTLHIWMELEDESSSGAPNYVANPPYNYTATEFITKAVSTTKYDAGSMVLTQLSGKDSETANKNGYTNGASASIVAVAETKVGKLTGASDLHYPTTVSVDGTQYNANCRFVYGRDDAMKFANYGTTYTFYFDANGNVIGCGPVAAGTSEYVVMTKIYSTHEKGVFALKADLYTLAGEKLEDVTVSAKAGSFAGTTEGKSSEGEFYATKKIDALAKNNDPYLTNALYSYTVTDDVYTLTWVGLWGAGTAPEGFGRYAAGEQGSYVYHEAKRANVMDAGSMIAFNFTESTKFICKGVDGTWKAYTGYTELPALSAQYIDCVDNDGDGYMDVVYLGGVSYAGDKIVGYVPTWKAFNWANGYDVITVYVKGEAVKVNLLHGDQYEDANFGDVLRDPGMYEFEMAVDEDGVTYCTVKSPVTLVKYREGVVSQGNDKTAIQVGDNLDLPAIGLTGVAIYVVEGDVVTAVDKDYIMPGDYVVVYKDATTGEIAEIYIVG